MPGSDSSPLHLIPSDDDEDTRYIYGYPESVITPDSTITDEMRALGVDYVICYCVQIEQLRDPRTGYCHNCREGRITVDQAIAMNAAYYWTNATRAKAYSDTPTAKIVHAELFSLLSQSHEGVVNESHPGAKIIIRPDHAAPGSYAVYFLAHPMLETPRRFRSMSAMSIPDILNWLHDHVDANLDRDAWTIISPKEEQ